MSKGIHARRPKRSISAGASVAGQTIENLLQNAIDVLKRELRLQVTAGESHQVTFVRGLETPEATEAFAAYALVAGIGQGIRVNLSIATEMLGGGPEFGVELKRQVERTIGASNVIQDDFREDQRDPWFTECLGHALLSISRDVVDLAPPGPVIALTLVHTDVRDHGLDLVGLHLEQSLLGLNISEAKASENNASLHSSATATLFAQVDAGARDPEIRGKVQLLRDALAPGSQSLVTPGFWHGRRAYIAVVSYRKGSSFAPTRTRPTYARLAVGPARIRLLAVPINNYRAFFDSVADRVRNLVSFVAQAGG